MPNLSRIKHQRMLDFLEILKKEHTDDESICWIALSMRSRRSVKNTVHC